MRNHLNRFTQIVSTTLFVDNAFVDASCSNVVRLSRLYAQKSFIMSQVEIGFVSVYRYIAFSVLVWIQSSRVDVDVRVKLLNGYILTSCL